MKPGYLTSEFWLTAIAALLFVLHALGLHPPFAAPLAANQADLAQQIVAAIVAVYTLARTLLKIFAPKYAPPAITAQSTTPPAVAAPAASDVVVTPVSSAL